MLYTWNNIERMAFKQEMFTSARGRRQGRGFIFHFSYIIFLALCSALTCNDLGSNICFSWSYSWLEGCCVSQCTRGPISPLRLGHNDWCGPPGFHTGLRASEVHTALNSDAGKYWKWITSGHSKAQYCQTFTNTHSCTHSHTDGGVNHAGRQPALQEQSGWDVSLRDNSTLEDQTSNLPVTSLFDQLFDTGCW